MVADPAANMEGGLTYGPEGSGREAMRMSGDMPQIWTRLRRSLSPAPGWPLSASPGLHLGCYHVILPLHLLLPVGLQIHFHTFLLQVNPWAGLPPTLHPLLGAPRHFHVGL